MKNQSIREFITVFNFGSIKKCENVELKRFTVLVSESGAGESSFMKLVRAIRYVYFLANVKRYLHVYSMFLNHISLRRLLAEYEIDHLVNDTTKIKYTVVQDDGTEYSIEFKNMEFGDLPKIKDEHLFLSGESFISEHRNFIFQIIRNKVMHKSLGHYFNRMLWDVIDTLSRGKSFNLDCVGAKIQYESDYESEYDSESGRFYLNETNYTVEQNGIIIPLVNAEASVQSLAVEKILLDKLANLDFKQYFFIHLINANAEKVLAKLKPLDEVKKQAYAYIEQTGNNLYVTQQWAYIEELVKSNPNTNMMLTTNSQVILDSLSVIINQNKTDRARLDAEELAVYQVSEGTVRSLKFKNEYGQWVVNTNDMTDVTLAIADEFIELPR